MTISPLRFPVVYLVELFNPDTLALEESDVCAKLELAVQKAYDHLCDSPLEPHVEVSFDEDGLVEGIGVFNEEEDLLACITVYHLDRDTDDATHEGIARACRGDVHLAQEALNRIFRSVN